jgi:hypothetical protein
VQQTNFSKYSSVTTSSAAEIFGRFFLGVGIKVLSFIVSKQGFRFSRYLGFDVSKFQGLRVLKFQGIKDSES